MDRDKSTFKSHRDFDSEIEITKTIIIFFITCSLLFQLQLINLLFEHNTKIVVTLLQCHMETTINMQIPDVIHQ